MRLGFSVPPRRPASRHRLSRVAPPTVPPGSLAPQVFLDCDREGGLELGDFQAQLEQVLQCTKVVVVLATPPPSGNDELRSGLSSMGAIAEYNKKGWTDWCEVEMVKCLSRPGCEVIPLYVNKQELGGDSFIGEELAKIRALEIGKLMGKLNAIDLDVGDVSVAELHDKDAPDALVAKIARNLERSVGTLEKMIRRKRRRDSTAIARRNSKVRPAPNAPVSVAVAPGGTPSFHEPVAAVESVADVPSFHAPAAAVESVADVPSFHAPRGSAKTPGKTLRGEQHSEEQKGSNSGALAAQKPTRTKEQDGEACRDESSRADLPWATDIKILTLDDSHDGAVLQEEQESKSPTSSERRPRSQRPLSLAELGRSQSEDALIDGLVERHRRDSMTVKKEMAQIERDFERGQRGDQVFI